MFNFNNVELMCPLPFSLDFTIFRWFAAILELDIAGSRIRAGMVHSIDA